MGEVVTSHALIFSFSNACTVHREKVSLTLNAQKTRFGGNHGFLWGHFFPRGKFSQILTPKIEISVA